MIRAVWEATVPTPTHLLVLVALAEYADSEGVCWPKVSTLAGRLPVKDRQVQRILRDLRSTGEIEVVESERGWRTRRYHLKGCHERHLAMTSTTPPDGSGGDTEDTSGVTPVTPPYRNRQRNPQRSSNRQRSDDSHIDWTKRRYELGKETSLESRQGDKPPLRKPW